MSKNKTLKEPLFKTFKERIEYEQLKWETLQELIKTFKQKKAEVK